MLFCFPWSAESVADGQRQASCHQQIGSFLRITCSDGNRGHGTHLTRCRLEVRYIAPAKQAHGILVESEYLDVLQLDWASQKDTESPDHSQKHIASRLDSVILSKDKRARVLESED